MYARTTTTLAVSLALLLAGCGGDDAGTAEPAAKAPASAAPAAAVDPKREWTSAVATICTDLAGVVAGRQIADFTDDNKITPDEIVAAQEAAAPALAAFDKGYAALPAPPEAAEAKKAFDAFLTDAKVTAAAVLAAGKAGDQAALEKALSAAEGVRLGPTGLKSFMAQGLPEKCRYRGSYV